jgi:hypothetical protein
MKQQILYALEFKDKPLVKVSLAQDAYARSLSLGGAHFDFSKTI